MPCKRTPRGTHDGIPGSARAGETLFEIAALEKLADHLGDHVAEDAVAGLVALGIDLEKLLEMGVDAAPERRSFRVAGLVDLLRHTAQCRKEPVPSNGTDPKKSEESEGCLPPPVLPDQAHLTHLWTAQDESDFEPLELADRRGRVMGVRLRKSKPSSASGRK